MGEVYRAENTLAGRPVALKILRPDLASDPNLVSRFFQEAQAVNKIRHPNIVDVIDAGMGDTGPFIVMECLNGESAAAALSRLGKLSVDATVAIGEGILAALEAAHRAGIVHRDLKPENVFLHRAGDARDALVVVKLLDFGIAKVLSTSGPTPRTHTGVVFGTPDYLSPEQASGEPVTDGRSDLFAAAVVLFELCTGQRPFRAETALATAYKVVNAPQPTFAQAGGPVHPDLEAILGKGLCKKPDGRYASAAEFLRALLDASPDERRRADALRAVLGRVRRAPAVSSSSTPLAVTPAKHEPAPYATPTHRSALAPVQESSGPPKSPPSSEPPTRSSRPSPSDTTRSSAPAAKRAQSACHVRGHVLRAADQWIAERHGSEIRNRILEKLPSGCASDFQHGSLAGVVLYDLAIFEAYASAATSIALRNDIGKWREIGRDSAEGELSTLLRVKTRGYDTSSFLRRCMNVWSRLIDFAEWTAQLKPDGEASLLVTDIGPAPLTLRHWLIGVVEQTLRRAGYTNATVAARVGEAARAPELDLVLHLGQLSTVHG